MYHLDAADRLDLIVEKAGRDVQRKGWGAVSKAFFSEQFLFMYTAGTMRAPHSLFAIFFLTARSIVRRPRIALSVAPAAAAAAAGQVRQRIGEIGCI